ncbi:histidine phosphatase family protein [Massilia sp. LXY-6]|uniref:histidine phosphatase family protein n=1 Tax=Massilia sp. LXY-6 TaxID=3379823 RepID=UPI003EE24B59
MKLYLVRHPQPEIGQGLCYGATDVPVTEPELARAHARLHAAGLPGDLPVYASPLQRCSRLARRLTPAPPTLDARLAEMDFGRWEMQAWDAIPRHEVDAWAADLLRYRPGGGECVLDVARRVAAFIDDLRADLSNELRQAGHAEALLICHAGTIRLLGAMRGGLPLEEAALNAASTPHRIGYGEMVVLEV